MMGIASLSANSIENWRDHHYDGSRQSLTDVLAVFIDPVGGFDPDSSYLKSRSR
jgi:hypothetical protein